MGCGHKPHGDVNVDVHIEKTFHRFDEIRLHSSLHKDRVKNLVRADAEYLPFRNNVFRVVYSRALLEHVNHPVKVLKEMLRVCDHIVTIRIPHRYSKAAKSVGHHSFFSATWFLKVSDYLGHYAQVETSKWDYFPHIVFPLFQLPNEIKVTMFKGKHRERFIEMG